MLVNGVVEKFRRRNREDLLSNIGATRAVDKVEGTIGTRGTTERVDNVGIAVKAVK